MGEEGGSLISKWFSNARDRKIRLVIGFGIIGMILILLSQMTSGKKPVKNAVETPTSDKESAVYTAELEERLSNLISSMEGAGTTKVMITLENLGETIYAREEKRNIDKQQETAPEETGKSYQKESTEQKYIIVDGQNGREALISTRLEPRIQGVVVMCEGAGNLKVEQDIINVVTTALNVPTTRVCVVKISNTTIREDIL